MNHFLNIIFLLIVRISGASFLEEEQDSTLVKHPYFWAEIKAFHYNQDDHAYYLVMFNFIEITSEKLYFPSKYLPEELIIYFVPDSLFFGYIVIDNSLDFDFLYFHLKKIKEQITKVDITNKIKYIFGKVEQFGHSTKIRSFSLNPAVFTQNIPGFWNQYTAISNIEYNENKIHFEINFYLDEQGRKIMNTEIKSENKNEEFSVVKGQEYEPIFIKDETTFEMLLYGLLCYGVD